MMTSSGYEWLTTDSHLSSPHATGAYPKTFSLVTGFFAIVQVTKSM